MLFVNIRYGRLFIIPRKIVKYLLAAIYPVVIRIWPLPKVESVEKTILKLYNEKKSIVRFGDGEILYITDKLNLPFQVYDESLALKLKEILVSEHEDVLVGLPTGYHTLTNLTRENKVFWRSQIAWNYPRFIKFLKPGKQYYNASITRLYYGFVKEYPSDRYFKLIRKLWDDRKILIIEGEKTRFGVGNDLLSNARSVERILGPATDAYSKARDIVDLVQSFSKDILILVALGPAAKAIAFDLALKGFQVFDVGNLDIEYEWFKIGSGQRVRIEGKYTSEVKGGRSVGDIDDPDYHIQIITRLID